MIATVPERYTLKHILAPTRITSERQYDEYAETLMRLDEKAEKARLSHQEESYAKILAAFIEEWDETHHPIDDASPIEVLQTLMEANNLRQKDLAPIFGTESIVSEVLHQKRALTVNHIVGLSQRFHVSPAVFFAERKIVAPKRNVLKTWTKVAKPNFEAARARAAAKMARAQRARWVKVRGRERRNPLISRHHESYKAELHSEPHRIHSFGFLFFPPPQRLADMDRRAVVGDVLTNFQSKRLSDPQAASCQQ